MKGRFLTLAALLVAGCTSLQPASLTSTNARGTPVDLYSARLHVVVDPPRRVQLLPDFWDQADFTLETPKLRGVQAKTVATATSSVQVDFLVPPGLATVSVQLKTRGQLVATGQATASLVSGSNAVDITLSVLDDRVMTLAGDPSVAAGPGPNLADGVGVAAHFKQPEGMTADGAGNLYVADWGNHAIRKVTPDGTVTTIAGNGTAGWADGVGTAARLTYPSDVAYDAATNGLYVADTSNHVIRYVDLATLAVTTPAGSPSVSGFADGQGPSAQFNTPYGLAVEASGSVLVADFYNQCIRRMTAAGVVTLIAGTRSAGSQDGLASSASFNGPKAVAIDSLGNVLIVDYFNQRLRKLAAGTVSTVAGSTSGYLDGNGTGAQFSNPAYLALDAFDTMYLADQFNHTVRTINTLAAVGSLFGTTAGYLDGLPTAAQFNQPCGIVVRGDRLYVTDKNNNCIRLYRRPPAL